jgi:CheY-like chemotaxis protein
MGRVLYKAQHGSGAKFEPAMVDAFRMHFVRNTCHREPMELYRKQAGSMMKKILLIEDDTICRKAVAAVLQHLGYTDVTCAVDGEDGLNLFDQMEPAPDVVISDVFMPRKDGIEVASGLVARGYAGGLILLSGGNPDVISMVESLAISGGLNLLAVLLKPLDTQALAHALRSLPSAE